MLAIGDITRNIEVEAHIFSKAAAEKIEKAGRQSEGHRAAAAAGLGISRKEARQPVGSSLKQLAISSASRIFGSGSCSRLPCWRFTGWAASSPRPGININRWQDFLHSQSGSIFGFFDLFAGGNIRRLSIFALGIMPYITASIILQLLTVVVPTLEKLQKEGELGRRKITQWTRYLTVPGHRPVVRHRHAVCRACRTMSSSIPGIGFVLMTILSLTTGTAFIMWLGEQITERGIGNGMSLIIFTGIVVGVPGAIGNLYTNVFVTHEWSPLTLAVVLIMMVAVVAFIVLVEMGERRIPVQYAKRVIGRRVMGGQSTHMPLKVNAGGVIPVIFASSILAFPQTAANSPFVQEQRLAQQHAGFDPARRAALRAAVRRADHLLLLLLRFDHFQSE